MPTRIDEFNVTLPDGCLIGVVGEAKLQFTQAPLLELLERRQKGETLFVRGLDPRFCDEIWWIKGPGDLRRGDPQEVIQEYRAAQAQRLRADAQGRQLVLPPALRRGDGRARLIEIETLDALGTPTSAWKSGEEAQIRVTVEFDRDVEDPVIGIMIRTRLGFEVYGTNTELDKIAFGPVRPGERAVVTFAFTCDLCPNEYALTAASHDPDGTWHDWMEDAVAFSVVDDRYTAGVANLRARVNVATTVSD
ncbi:MAG: Wzt carbohydrate-binding domain-containing protein [Acidobacteria bacterium]|nr:Wzt carbohydrate-binding domain-containing protein [Acidobacteriota bacterium]